MGKLLEFAVQTNIGKVREQNEDSYAYFIGEADWPAAFIVADGMGGHSHGELASKSAVEFCRDHLQELLPTKDQPDRLPDLLKDTVQKANVEVYLKSLENEANKGMGTTLTLNVFYEGCVYLAHIGDSRSYLLRKGQLVKLSRDHTLVQEMQDAGELTEEEGSRHPQRHILTQALGIPEFLHADVARIETKKQDRFLICSDGLHGYVPEAKITSILMQAADPTGCADDLVEAALEAGGFDNITAFVIFV